VISNPPGGVPLTNCGSVRHAKARLRMLTAWLCVVESHVVFSSSQFSMWSAVTWRSCFRLPMNLAKELR